MTSRSFPTYPPPIIPSPPSQSAINALLKIPSPHCIEIASVGWYGAQTWIHYSDAQWDKTFPKLATYNLSPIQARFDSSKWRAEFTRTSDLSDDTMTLVFNDVDWNITALWWGYGGEGVPVIITQYFADVDLLIEIFDGYLRTPEEADGFSFSVKCAAGFRSPNIVVPRRVIYAGCQALFGGLINPTTNSPWFPTQTAIDANDCPYNRHITGGNYGNLNGTVPFTDCPRSSPKDCIARLGEAPQWPPPQGGQNYVLSYLGFDVVLGAEVIGTPWNNWQANIRANETALKTPIRVVYGTQRVQNLTLLAYESQSGGLNPQNGFLKTLWIICEGQIAGIGPQQNYTVDSFSGPGPSSSLDSQIRINGEVIPCQHVDWSGTFGIRRQPVAQPWYGSPKNPGAGFPGQLNYSATSYINVNYGPQDFRNFDPNTLDASARVFGKKDIKMYATSTSQPTLGYTDNRAWCLLDLLTHKRYGLGLDVARLNLDDWVTLAAWCDDKVTGYDETGTAVQITRSTFNGAVDGRAAQQTLGDFCMMGRFTPPFQDQGKLRVLPLREDEAPMGANPAWTGVTFADFDNDLDATQQRNIVWQDGKSSLVYTIQSDADICNEIKFTFNDTNYDDTERPLLVQNLNAQLLAGRAAGDESFRVVSKSYAGMGIAHMSEAARMGTMLLYFGENDSGGIANNFTIKFTTWSVLGKLFGLHPFQVIRVLSRRINRFTESGTLAYPGPAPPPLTPPGGPPAAATGAYASDSFQFFRIMSMKRASSLLLEIEAQLYARSALQQFAKVALARDAPMAPFVPAPGTDNPVGQRTEAPGPQPAVVQITTTGAGAAFKLQ